MNVVAGDVRQVALVHVRPAAQPCSSHAAPLEAAGKRAFDDLGDLCTQFEGSAGNPRLELGSVVGDRAPRRLITAPVGKAGLLRLGDRRTAAVRALQ